MMWWSQSVYSRTIFEHFSQNGTKVEQKQKSSHDSGAFGIRCSSKTLPRQNQCFMPDYSNFTWLERLERNWSVLFTQGPSTIHKKNSIHVLFPLIKLHYTRQGQSYLYPSLIYLFIWICHFRWAGSFVPIIKRSAPKFKGQVSVVLIGVHPHIIR